MSARDKFNIGDHVTATLRDSKGNVKQVVSSLDESVSSLVASSKVQFCPECGEPLTLIPMYYCKEGCKSKYLLRMVEGKFIILSIGKEEGE